MGQNNKDFTENAWDRFYNTVDVLDFSDKSPELIHKELTENLGIVGFGDYLKRYVYEKAGFQEDFSDIPLEKYQKTIEHSFKEKDTPCSFEPTSTKLSAAVKNWLTHRTVSRKAILLLGFGLNMSVDDVNTFLTKGIFEQELNPKDPLEAICWYCYTNKYSFLTFEDLWDKYNELPAGLGTDDSLSMEATVNVRNTLYAVHNEKSLMDYLSNLKVNSYVSRFSRTAKKEFENLYAATLELIAKLDNDAQMNLNVHEQKTVTAEQISAGRVEEILCDGIPRTKSGNLEKEKLSDLKDVFVGKRLSRQRINQILSSETDVTRFDLITLNFFIYSQKVDEIAPANKLWYEFRTSTDNILERCFMQKLIIQNPYENFVLSCMLSEDPLMTYNEVWESSFSKE